jgi:hypothetical protein
VRQDNWRIDATGYSTSISRITSSESSKPGFSSEKVIGGLDGGYLASRKKCLTELSLTASEPSVATRSVWIATTERPFPPRYRTIDLAAFDGVLQPAGLNI